MTTYSFVERLNMFFNTYLLKQRNLSNNTIRAYKTTFKLFINYVIKTKHVLPKNINFDIFNRENILDFLNYLEKDLSSTTITRNQRLAALKSFCNYILEEETNDNLEMVRILKISQKKAESKEINYLTKDELTTFFNSITTNNRKGIRDYNLIVVLYDTGCREEELINIKIEDLRLDDNPCITLYGKGKKHRTIPLTIGTKTLIKEYIKLFHLSSYDYLFPGNKKEKASTKMVVHVVEKYAKVANINKNIHPHIFRHTRAMHLLESGIALIDISNFLGHSSVTTTEIYAKTNIETKRRAIASVYTFNDNINNAWNKDEQILKDLFMI